MSALDITAPGFDAKRSAGRQARRPAAPRPKARLEKNIERNAVRQIEQRGALCPKFVSPGRRSAPDRIVLPGDGRCFFIEFKRPCEKPTPLQEQEHKKLRARGYVVLVAQDESAALRAYEEFVK